MDLVRNDLVSSKEVSRLLAFMESERRYFQEIFAMLPVVLAVVSPDYKIVSVNRAFRKLFGVPGYGAQRSELSEFLPGEGLKKRLEEVVLSGKPQENAALSLSGPPARSFRLAILPLPESEDSGRCNALIVLEDLTSEPNGHPAANSPNAVTAGEPETVLIVDSDSGIRALMGNALTHQGYVVLEASDANEAIRLSLERLGPIHIALSDARTLPVSGTDLIGQLRRHRPELRALYVDSDADDNTRDSGPVSRHSGYLRQPFTLSSLLTKVRSLLDAD